jgi:hypothetical protein
LKNGQSKIEKISTQDAIPKKGVAFVFAILSTLFSLGIGIHPAKAYKPEVHEMIADYSWKKFNKCLATWNVTAPGKLIEQATKVVEEQIMTDIEKLENEKLIIMKKVIRKVEMRCEEKKYVRKFDDMDQLKKQRALGKWVAAASCNEDRHTLSRALNWHFISEKGNRTYNDMSGKKSVRILTKVLGYSLPKGDRKVNMTPYLVFKKIEDSLKYLVEDENKPRDLKPKAHEFFRLAGKTLHYIEDATVPAHVVPAYHGPLLPGLGKEKADSDKWGSPIGDEVDGYAMDKNNKMRIYPDLGETDQRTKAACDEVLNRVKSAAGSKDPLRKVLDDTADKTREAIKAPIDPGVPELKNQPWSFFWTTPEKEEGFFSKLFFWKKPGIKDGYFSKYNVTKNIKKGMCVEGESGGLFGKIICLNGKEVAVSPETYEKFVKDRMNQAVLADMTALYIISFGSSSQK